MNSHLQIERRAVNARRDSSYPIRERIADRICDFLRMVLSERLPKLGAGGVEVGEMEAVATGVHDVLSRLFGRWVVEGFLRAKSAQQLHK